MNKTRTLLVLLALLSALLLISSVEAMSSANYQLDWFTPMTGSGGPTISTNYAANFTVGQTAIGASSSANYQAGLGYWYGMAIRKQTVPKGTGGIPMSS